MNFFHFKAKAPVSSAERLSVRKGWDQRLVMLGGGVDMNCHFSNVVNRCEVKMPCLPVCTLVLFPCQGDRMPSPSLALQTHLPLPLLSGFVIKVISAGIIVSAATF